MEMIQTLSYSCDICNGKGYVYWRNRHEYDVEKCECRDGDLFTNGEND